MGYCLDNQTYQHYNYSRFCERSRKHDDHYFYDMPCSDYYYTITVGDRVTIAAQAWPAPFLCFGGNYE